MHLKYICFNHTFPLISSMLALYKQSCNSFKSSGGTPHSESWTSKWHNPVRGVRAHVLTIQVYQLRNTFIQFNIKLPMQCSNGLTWPWLFIAMGVTLNNIYLLIPTRLLPATWDYNRHHFTSHKYQLEFNNRGLAENWIGSTGPKAVMLPLCYDALLTSWNNLWLQLLYEKRALSTFKTIL